MSNEHLKPHLQACLDASMAMTGALQRLHHALGQPVPNGGQVSAGGDTDAAINAAAQVQINAARIEAAIGSEARAIVKKLGLSTSQKYSVREIDERLDKTDIPRLARTMFKMNLVQAGMMGLNA